MERPDRIRDPFEEEEGKENKENLVHSFLFVVPKGIEPVPLDVIDAANKNDAIEIFEQKTGRPIDSSIAVVQEDSSENENIISGRFDNAVDATDDNDDYQIAA